MSSSTKPSIPPSLLREFEEGRTDLVFPLLAQGLSPEARNEHGISLLQTCAYYGDVSAIRFLLSQGATLDSLGRNLSLDSACVHGHWRLTKFLLEQGADPNQSDPETGETPLHSVLSKTDRLTYDLVLQLLLAHGADPNTATRYGAETGAFMRDCRTKGETPLHRAAAFGEEETIQMLLNAGARLNAKDGNGETALSWASWYGRPTPILRLLCYGDFKIRPTNRSMRANLLGTPAP
jgi:uncharacterized protein